MSRISRAFDFLTAPQLPDARTLAVPPEQRAADPLALSLLPQAASWSLVADDRVIDTAHKVGVVIACITLLADAVSEAPLRVYREVNGQKTEQPNHRARKLFANPNDRMSEAEFIGLLVVQMATQGYAVVEIERSAAGIPLNLWPLRPDWLSRRRLDAETWEWRYRVPTTEARTIAQTDLLVVPYRHDDRLERPGVSPIAAIGREIGIDFQLTEFLKVYLDAGGIPPFVFTYPDPITDSAEIEAFQIAWANKYGGARAYGKIPVLHGGFDVKQVGSGVGEMAWPDLRSLTEDRIAQAFRVPRELIGTRSAAGGQGLTTTEIDGALRALQLFGARPLRQRIDGAFTRAILTEFVGNDPEYSLEFDETDVKSLQEDEDAKHARARADFAAGGITRNEFRAEIGYPPLIGGDVIVVTIAQVEEPVNGTAARMLGGGLEHRSGPAYERRARQADTSRLQMHRIAAAHAPAIARYFTGQRERLLAAMGLRGHRNGSAPERRAVAELLDWMAEDDELARLLRSLWAAAGVRAFDVAAAQLNASLRFDLANPRILDILSQVATRVTAVSETTQRDIARVVGQWTQDGGDLPALRDRLFGLYDETYANRSMAIARTESQVAYNLGSQEAYRQSGVVEECQLFDNPDHTEDYGASDGLSCADRNGLVVPLGSVDLHVFAEHPNGTLAVAPVIAD